MMQADLVSVLLDLASHDDVAFFNREGQLVVFILVIEVESHEVRRRELVLTDGSNE